MFFFYVVAVAITVAVLFCFVLFFFLLCFFLLLLLCLFVVSFLIISYLFVREFHYVNTSLAYYAQLGKVFFQLGEKNYNKKTIGELRLQDESTTCNEQEILDQIEAYFKNLSSSSFLFSPVGA